MLVPDYLEHRDNQKRSGQIDSEPHKLMWWPLRLQHADYPKLYHSYQIGCDLSDEQTEKKAVENREYSLENGDRKLCFGWSIQRVEGRKRNTKEEIYKVEG